MKIVGILINSRHEELLLQNSGMFKLLKDFGIYFETTIISSERNPEELRSYCLDNKKRLRLVIAIAGGVPTLPIVVKSWLPNIPVICVPIENNPDFALAALTTPGDHPIIVAGYGIKGLQKAAYITKDIITL